MAATVKAGDGVYLLPAFVLERYSQKLHDVIRYNFDPRESVPLVLEVDVSEESFDLFFQFILTGGFRLEHRLVCLDTHDITHQRPQVQRGQLWVGWEFMAGYKALELAVKLDSRLFARYAMQHIIHHFGSGHSSCIFPAHFTLRLLDEACMHTDRHDTPLHEFLVALNVMIGKDRPELLHSEAWIESILGLHPVFHYTVVDQIRKRETMVLDTNVLLGDEQYDWVHEDLAYLLGVDVPSRGFLMGTRTMLTQSEWCLA